MEGPEQSLRHVESLYNGCALTCTFEEKKTYRTRTSYSVILRGKIQVQGELRKVVSKTYRRLDGVDATKVAQRTYREVKAWVTLASYPRHCDNINQFHGVWFTDSDLITEAIPGVPSIVTDYVKYSSLEYTAGQDFGLRLNIARQLVNGLSFMHSLNLVHGDMKPDNYRVNGNGTGKIIDFGLSREQTVEHTGFTTTINPTYLFIAPELIIPDEDDVSMSVTKASDVYACSMTVLQILDGQGDKSIPFNHCRQGYPVRKAITNNQWPQEQRYPGVKPQAWKIISACWTKDPSTRPSIDALFQDLSGVPPL
ncbi:hypothetical protein EST38_g3778 [Candolleomyces aberdarensis]|uniref:Protein kinase domain-containing protein n=1 Tax=Candolleomyces aberdarensis TaxID=2316362 RepID=A0A4Q2DRE6_9AGAR|nr:hypothetical protein EST38_g3778 [Candolleomyces aberdarensis]